MFVGYRAFTFGLGLKTRARASGSGSGLNISELGLGLKPDFSGSGSSPTFRARAPGSGSGFEISKLGLGLSFRARAQLLGSNLLSKSTYLSDRNFLIHIYILQRFLKNELHKKDK